ncbi:phospholemman isoform X1 [Oryctolagus cuniculus]|uniref:phospholemman isoform X1 n=1 Tax=Oryctolagus cuniculus TaxID=9986 RepID=UPI0038791506
MTPEWGKPGCCHGGLCEANSSSVKWDIFIHRVRPRAGGRLREGGAGTWCGHGHGLSPSHLACLHGSPRHGQCRSAAGAGSIHLRLPVPADRRPHHRRDPLHPGHPHHPQQAMPVQVQPAAEVRALERGNSPCALRSVHSQAVKTPGAAERSQVPPGT